MVNPIIIDTDMAFGSPNADVDDSLAILTAFSFKFNIKAITAVGGNVSADKSSKNIEMLLKRLEKTDILHSYSCSEPIDPSRWIHSRWRKSSEPFVCRNKLPTMPSSVELMRNILDESEEQTTIVSIGPMTNIALLLTMYPDCSERIKSIYSMGGSIFMPGLGNSPLEFNIKADPEAAQIVFSSGIPIVLFPLDVTKKNRIFPETISKWSKYAGIINDFHDSSVSFMRFRAQRDGYNTPYAFYHDIFPVIGIIRPDLFKFQSCSISVELNDCESRGRTLINTNEKGCKVAVDAASETIFELVENQLFMTYGNIK